MMISLSRTDLQNKAKARAKLEEILSGKEFPTPGPFREEEMFHLVLSALRANEDGLCQVETSGRGIKYLLDTDKIKEWVTHKVIPNTLVILPEDPDLLKLLMFSLAMPYKMFSGATRATMSEKTRRTKQRDFVQIFSDTFIGKIGEIAFRKFALQHFKRDITLDWGISTEIKSFSSDVIGSRKTVSIKSTDTLESIWAEAPTTADYGVFIKVALPKDFFMKLLAHISSLKKLLNYLQEKIEPTSGENQAIRELIAFVEKTAYEEKMIVKSYITGYFKTSENTLRRHGEELPFLGEVHGDKHLLEISHLKWSREDWDKFFETVI